MQLTVLLETPHPSPHFFFFFLFYPLLVWVTHTAVAAVPASGLRAAVTRQQGAGDWTRGGGGGGWEVGGRTI